MSDKPDSQMSGEDVANKIGAEYKRHGGYVVVSCYNTASHNQGDRKPSLTIYDGNKGYYCYACGESGTHSWLLKQFGIEDRDYGSYRKTSQRVLSGGEKKTVSPPPPKKYTTYPIDSWYDNMDGLPPAAVKILEAKGFPAKTWEDVAGFRWHVSSVAGWPTGVFIPYYLDGKMVAARLRSINDTGARFLGLPGGESFPYFADNLKKEKAYVCEGESDCLTLNFLGFPAVGIPGSTNKEAIRKMIAMAAENGCKLTVIPDNDEAGSDFLNRIRQEAFNQFVAVDALQLPGYKDVNDWYVAVGQEAFSNSIINYEKRGVFVELPKKFIQIEIGAN